jgi:hypothetical protein
MRRICAIPPTSKGCSARTESSSNSSQAAVKDYDLNGISRPEPCIMVIFGVTVSSQIMIKSGKPIDGVIGDLAPLLHRG